MNKKILLISGILLIIIALIILNWISNDKVLNDTDLNNAFSEVNGVFIYSNWDAYIYSYTNDSITVQIPVYEFNQSLSEGTSINILNFHIGEVKDISLELKNQFTHFNQYILQFNLIPNNNGNHNLNNLTIEIISNDKRYEGKLGEWVFEIVEPHNENHISIAGGSSLSQWVEIPIGFQHRSELFNRTNSKINLESVIINHHKINVLSTNLTDIAPNEKIKIYTDIDVSNTYGNVLIKPKLQYSIDGNKFELPLNQTIFASVVTLEELHKLVVEEDLNK